MPRERRPKRELFQEWFDNDPEGFRDLRIIDNEYDLFCSVCERFINSSDKTKVTRHLRSHASSNAEDSVFFYELTVAFLKSNIPLNKLENPKLRTFLKKYMNRKIPHESTLRRGYIDQVYNDVVTTICEDITDDTVYFVVDEITDTSGHVVANFLIGSLKRDKASDSHLLASRVLAKTSHETIVIFVTECLQFMWPNEDASDKVLIMLSDATAHMLKAGEILSRKYQKMIHFTCVTHTLNRVAEKIRDSFPLVNSFITKVTNIFFKAPARRGVFKDTLPGTPLPPKIVDTKWGTWVQAVAYYDKHFESIKDVIYKFNRNDSSAIYTLQNLLKDQRVRHDVCYINRHYGFLVDAIRKSESHRLSLNEQFRIMDDVQKNIYSVNIRPVSCMIKEELQSLLKENPGYPVLENISKVLAGTCEELPANILKYKSCLSNFSYCPLSTIDERSFSMHKLILNDRRGNFTPENMEKHVVICFNNCQYATETLPGR